MLGIITASRREVKPFSTSMFAPYALPLEDVRMARLSRDVNLRLTERSRSGHVAV
jgi:hypothetical protein